MSKNVKQCRISLEVLHEHLYHAIDKFQKQCLLFLKRH